MAIGILALAALAASPPAPSSGSASASVTVPVPARASAIATVRILSGARVRLGEQADSSGYALTKASVRTEDGQRRPAKLVEFQ